MDNVLKDDLGNILNPKIPRYEKDKNIKFKEPFKTGRKINYNNKLRDEYSLFFDVGTLPNTNTKKIPLGEFNFKNKVITKVVGSAFSEVGEVIFFPRYVNSSSFINMFVSASNTLEITTGNDSSKFNGIVEISYIDKN